MSQPYEGWLTSAALRSLSSSTTAGTPTLGTSSFSFTVQISLGLTSLSLLAEAVPLPSAETELKAFQSSYNGG